MRMTASTLKAMSNPAGHAVQPAPAGLAAPYDSAILSTYKRAPVEFVRGNGVYLYDAEGKAYLDFVAGIAVNALGYEDAGLKAAMHAAVDGLIHTSNLYSTSAGERLAAAFVSRSFADKVFFCNSGAEANEGAFKFARRWARTLGEAKLVRHARRNGSSRVSPSVSSAGWRHLDLRTRPRGARCGAQ
jgi:acetylornithine/succinyldiaminopimelate/putrescine aminotransferase